MILISHHTKNEFDDNDKLETSADDDIKLAASVHTFPFLLYHAKTHRRLHHKVWISLAVIGPFYRLELNLKGVCRLHNSRMCLIPFGHAILEKVLRGQNWLQQPKPKPPSNDHVYERRDFYRGHIDCLLL